MISAKRLLHAQYAGVEVNIYQANIGEGVPMHIHAFAHGTICQSGSCKITCGEESFVIANNIMHEMPANVPHEIEALEDGTTIVNIIPNQGSKA
jgi:quercetin dioxygenase-like cupin family protein